MKVEKVRTCYIFKDKEEFLEFREYLKKFKDDKYFFPKAKEGKLNLIRNEEYVGMVDIPDTAPPRLTLNHSLRLEKRVEFFLKKHPHSNNSK